jgi:hypothetical protein
MPKNSDADERLVKVENVLDEHERIRKNSTDPHALERVDGDLKKAIHSAIDDEVVDEYLRQRGES